MPIRSYIRLSEFSGADEIGTFPLGEIAESKINMPCVRDLRSRDAGSSNFTYLGFLFFFHMDFL